MQKAGFNYVRFVGVGIIILLFMTSSTTQTSSIKGASTDGKIIKIIDSPKSDHYKPLDQVTIKFSIKTDKPSNMISTDKSSVFVSDGSGREYIKLPYADSLTFQVGGALGTQIIVLKDHEGVILDKAFLKVNCKTEISDQGDKYKNLLNTLYWTMVGWNNESGSVRIDGQFYHFFVSWLRDHVHTMKGMKYFYPELKSAIDLYSNYQREDGMIWDNISRRDPESFNHWQKRFGYGNFVKTVDNGNYEFHRIAVEADVEYLFIEGLYYTWKATGDDNWMASKLDNAIKAYKYSTSDPYRWSEKYHLIKRGRTIDTWDFQDEEDAAISDGDPMVIYKDKTKFNIMYGDNTGMSVACKYLAEMLNYVGRTYEGTIIRSQGMNLKNNLDKLAWNGNFYTHQIPEDTTVKRDFGVDVSKQVSLSNAYSLNRDISHEKCVQIIKTYQRLKEEMPKSSPGEWYTIYPPFQKGYDGHNGMWEYMNGSVTSIVAGELAHGAFENGFESYGVDILNRVADLAAKSNNYLYCTYRGAMPDVPKRNFTPVSLKDIANADITGQGATGVPGWTGEGDNDFHNFPVGKQTFSDVPFDIIDPAANGRKACLAISGDNGYKLNEKLVINRKAASIYFVHVVGKGDIAGNIVLHYSDSSVFTDIIGHGKIANWWYPVEPVTEHGIPITKIAWRGENSYTKGLGALIYGLNNPFIDKTIAYIEFQGFRINTRWMILGVTLSDSPVYFTPSFISYGIPDNWGAAAVVYALIEGLAGVKDMSVTFNQVIIAPRWLAAHVNEVSNTTKYEASGGYVSYNYKFNAKENKIELNYTGNAVGTDLQILLPEGKNVDFIYLDGRLSQYKIKKTENSSYVYIPGNGLGVHKLICNIK